MPLNPATSHKLVIMSVFKFTSPVAVACAALLALATAQVLQARAGLPISVLAALAVAGSTLAGRQFIALRFHQTCNIDVALCVLAFAPVALFLNDTLEQLSYLLIVSLPGVVFSLRTAKIPLTGLAALVLCFGISWLAGSLLAPTYNVLAVKGEALPATPTYTVFAVDETIHYDISLLALIRYSDSSARIGDKISFYAPFFANFERAGIRFGDKAMEINLTAVNPARRHLGLLAAVDKNVNMLPDIEYGNAIVDKKDKVWHFKSAQPPHPLWVFVSKSALRTPPLANKANRIVLGIATINTLIVAVLLLLGLLASRIERVATFISVPFDRWLMPTLSKVTLNNRTLLAAFGAIFLILVFRDIRLLYIPRLWAEDGWKYYSALMLGEGSSGLLYYVEYLRIVSNLGSLFANFMSMMNAPFAYTYTALAFHVGLIAMVLWSRSELYQGWGKVLFALCLVIAPYSSEIWLNTNGTQFITVVFALLLLFEQLPDSSWRRWTNRIFISISVLNGPLTALTAPLYVYRSLTDRKQREFRLYTAIICVGALVQIVADQFSASPELFEQYRDSPTTLAVAIWLFATKFLMGTVNHALTDITYLLYVNTLASDNESLFVYISALLGFASFGLVAGCFYLFRHSPKRFLLVFLVIYLAAVCIGALAPNGKAYLLHSSQGYRYFFVSAVMVLLLLICTASSKPATAVPSAVRYLCTVILVLALINGVQRYSRDAVFFDDKHEWAQQLNSWVCTGMPPVSWPYSIVQLPDPSIVDKKPKMECHE